MKVIQGARTESVPLGELKILAEERALLFDQEPMSFAMVGENSSYIASVGYASEKGLMKKNTESNEKFTINFGFNTQLKKWLFTLSFIS